MPMVNPNMTMKELRTHRKRKGKKPKPQPPVHSFPTTLYAREMHCEDCGADVEVSGVESEITCHLISGDTFAVYVLKEVLMCRAVMQREFEVVAHD